MVGVGRHLRQPTIVQQLVDAGPDAVHRQPGVLLGDAQAYRIRSDVFVTAALDEFEDLFVARFRFRHALATLARPEWIQPER